MFDLSEQPLDAVSLKSRLAEPRAGACVTFEGWVRNHNEGRTVLRLEYEAFAAVARTEGNRIIEEAVRRFGVYGAWCVHRVGRLEIGEMAVWAGACAAHRDEAFAACRYVIDEIKHRLPIWKKEHYVDGEAAWVNCQRCTGHEHGAHAE